MLTPRTLRFAASMALAIIGGGAIALCAFTVLGPIGHRPPDAARIALAPIVVAAAMIWACAFSMRARAAMDEFQRQRDLSVGYWGAWLGLAASAPFFLVLSLGGLSWIDPRIQPAPQTFHVFIIGYFLPVLTMVLGVVVVGAWRRLRQKS